MPVFFANIHIHNLPGLILFLILWIVLYKVAHVLVMLWRHEPLVGWAVGPFGLKFVALHEPSLLYLWFDVLFPACVSGGTLYVAFFSAISPITLPHYPFVKFLVVICGILITSTADLLSALYDLRHPLWGEARLLRNIQMLRANWSCIHFTPFGRSYVHTHFGENPRDLLQILSI